METTGLRRQWTCFPGITGENSVVYRKQLRGYEPWESLIICHNLDPSNPIIYCQWIFKTIWNLCIFHKTFIFHGNSFYFNTCLVSVVTMLYKNFYLSSRELESILWLSQLIIDRSKDANSEDWVELPGISAEIWNRSFHKEKRLTLEGWEAFALTLPCSFPSRGLGANGWH